MYDCGGGIFCVDAHYEGTCLAAVYILRSGGHAAIIETASNSSLPYVLSALYKLGLKCEDVDFVCVTHVHLDHAGGAGSYMREFPNAKFVVHPRGARHMIDPSRLIASVRSVYGDAETERLYGTILPIPAERVIKVLDGQELSFGDMTLVCYDAPGHAKHHIVLLEKGSRALFSGDAFGVSYGWMTGYGHKWAIPTSSPVQFDPDAMAATIKKIISLEPARIFLTHFGEISDIRENASLLTKLTKLYADIADEEHGDKERIKAHLIKVYEKLIAERCSPVPDAPVEKLLPVDLELNSQGLAFMYEMAHR